MFLVQDVFIPILIVLAQVVIGRLFFTQWRKRLPPAVAIPIRYVLYALWFSIAISMLLHYPPIVWFLRWCPASLRSVFSALGNIWGMASVASLGIYRVWRLSTGEGAVRHSPARRSLINAVGIAAVSAPFAVAAFGAIVNRTNFRIKEIDLPIPGLHPDLEGLRIGQLSDLHVSPWLSPRELGRAVDMLNELKPHLTVVTGDIITQVGDPLDEAIRELARLRADAGILGCLGNHEAYARCQDYATSSARSRGIEILRHEARLLRWGNGTLNVVGVDYQRSQRIRPYLPGAETLVVGGAANLLLSHNPDVFPVAVRKGYGAMLSGHTHGGQVTVEIVDQTLNLARFATPYVAGLYRIEGRSCYVTAGIGTIAMPVRIGALPEITLARLRSA